MHIRLINKNVPLARRTFLGSATGTVMIAGLAATARAGTPALKTVASPDAVATLVAMARDIYPHDRIPDLYFATAIGTIDRQLKATDDTSGKRKFKTYPISHFNIDIAEVQTAEGKRRLFVAIDRTSKFAFVELHREASNVIAAVPYAIHTVLTDNGIQFTNMAHHKYAFHHIFDRVCDEQDIDHRLTKIKHP